jgi:hypothetical protein
MEKLPKYLVVFAAVFVLLVCGYFLLLYVFDGSTSVILQTYEITRDKEMVRNDLLEYRGEGEGMTSRINFVAWGIHHPDDFVEITEGIDLIQREQFCELLGFTATDSGQDKAFEAAFEKYDGYCLRIIRSEIIKNREWQLRLKTSQKQ